MASKFVAMFSAVLMLFFGMIIFSQINPELNKAKEDIAKEDPTGMATKTLETQNSIPNPKNSIKQGFGTFLLNLAESNPMGFMILALIVTFIFLVIGVSVAKVKGF